MKTYRWLYLINMFIAMGMGGFVVYQPFFFLHRGHGATLVGLSLALWALLDALLAPVWGRCSDLWNRKVVLVSTLIIMTLGFVMVALPVRGIWALFVGMALLGIVLGGTGVVVRAFILDFVPKEEHYKALGYVGMTMGIGFAVGPILTTLAVLLDAEHLYTYVPSVGLLLSIASIFLLLYVPSRPKVKLDHPGFIFLLRKSVVWKAMTGQLIEGLTFTGFETIFAVWLTQKFGATPLQAGSLLLLCILVFAFIQAPAARLIKPLRPPRVVALGLLSGALAMLCLVLAHGYLLITLGVILTGIGYGLSFPSLQGWVNDILTEGDRGAGLSLLQATGSFARILAPMAFVFLYNAWGSGAYFLGLVLGIIGVIVVLFSGRSAGHPAPSRAV